MKTSTKMISVGSVLLSFMLVIAGAPSVRADQDDGDYLLTGLRITSRCNINENTHGPQIPAPLAALPGCPSVHPNASWSFDISFFDPVFQKVYIADRDNFGMDIVDTRTDTAVGLVKGYVGVVAGTNTSGPNGVLTTHNPNLLWGGDGNGDVRIDSLDNAGLPTGAPTIVISHTVTKTSHRADELGYDPVHQRVLVAWDDDADLLMAIISVSATPTVLHTINLHPLNPTSAANSCTNAGFPGGCSTGGIEQPQYDPRINRFLVAIPASKDNPNGEVLVINPTSGVVEKAWNTTTSQPSVGTACSPNGLTIGPGHQVLLGCSGGAVADGFTGNPQVTLIIDDRGSGPQGSNINIIKTITEVGGSDEVWFNPGDNNYYTASSNHTCTGLVGGPTCSVLGIIEAGTRGESPEFIQNVVTGAGSHSVTAVYGVQCERDDRGRGDDKWGDRRRGDDKDRDNCIAVNNRVYVPLRINQKFTPALADTNDEVGGIGIVKNR